MADDVTLNAGSGGSVIAADDIASVFFQRVKLIHGADGTNDGDVSTANPFPADIRELGGVAITLNVGDAGTGTLRIVPATCPAGSPTQFSCLSTTSQAIAANTNRKSLTIYNKGTEEVYFNPGAAAVVATHFPIPAGTSVTITSTEAVNMISATTTNDIRLYEEAWA